MLKPDLIPTPLVPPKEREPVRIVPFEDVTNRRWSICRHLALWLFDVLRMWLTRKWTPVRNAQRTRQMLEQLGYLWIKAGQLLSLRADFFSLEFCQELSRLQYSTTGFDPERARDIIERELGAPWKGSSVISPMSPLPPPP